MNSAWFEDVSHPAQDFKKEEEEIEYWDNFYSFYKEVVANKHLWKRDMLAITYIDEARKYSYVGLEVIHPYKNCLITLYAGGHNYYPITKIETDRRELGYFHHHGLGHTMLNNQKEECDRNFQDFLKKYPELKLAHSSTFVFSAKNVKINDVGHYDYNLQIRKETLALTYDLNIHRKDSKQCQNLDKKASDFFLYQLDRKCDYWRPNDACHFYKDEFLDLFTKVHRSLPKEFIQSNFAGLEKASANMEKRNEKLKAKYDKVAEKAAEKAKQEALKKEKKDRWAAVKSARGERLKSKAKQKVQQKGEDFLYLMKNNRDGRYKIGISNNPKHRESTLQSQEPDVVLVGSWDKLAKHERSWHNYFAEWRKRGEWFDLEVTQVRFMVDKCLNKKGPPKRKKINEETLENLG